MRIQEQKLDQFMKLGGYEIVKQVKCGKLKGHWRNLSQASKKTGISRPTIYKILQKYPENPNRIKTKYTERLSHSEGFKRFMQLYENRLCKRDLNQTIRYFQIAFRMLNGKNTRMLTLNPLTKPVNSKLTQTVPRKIYLKTCAD